MIINHDEDIIISQLADNVIMKDKIITFVIGVNTYLLTKKV